MNYDPPLVTYHFSLLTWALTSKRMKGKAHFGDINDVASKAALDAKEQEEQEEHEEP